MGNEYFCLRVIAFPWCAKCQWSIENIYILMLAALSAYRAPFLGKHTQVPAQNAHRACMLRVPYVSCHSRLSMLCARMCVTVISPCRYKSTVSWQTHTGTSAECSPCVRAQSAICILPQPFVNAVREDVCDCDFLHVDTLASEVWGVVVIFPLVCVYKATCLRNTTHYWPCPCRLTAATLCDSVRCT